MMWLWRWSGVENDPVSGKEKFVSAMGGFLALLTITFLCQTCLPVGSGLLLVASMGATAVLVFGVPHGALAQPWPVVGGHFVSAVIGVSCYQLIPHEGTAAGCAVGLSIGIMHQLKCIHPPGGATALTAVIGGPGINNLGFEYVLCPVLLNAVAMVLLAVCLNAPFSWRRYPAYLSKARRRADASSPSHEAIVAALRQIDSFVDITEDDLRRLLKILTTEQNLKVNDATESLR